VLRCDKIVLGKRIMMRYYLRIINKIVFDI